MNYIFKLSSLITLLFVIPGIFAKSTSISHNFDKAAFYTVMASSNLLEVNSMLATLGQSSIAEKTAYEGALLMKKAGLVKKPAEKLSLFKSGRAKLESALKEEEGNIEYHFLRLIIQENAPKIVKYKGALKEDTELVRTSFNKLPADIQQAIRDYSKNSTVLKPTDL